MSSEGKNILCTNREIMHVCQVNKIEQYWTGPFNLPYVSELGGSHSNLDNVYRIFYEILAINILF